MERITVTISIPAHKQLEFGILLGQIGGTIVTNPAEKVADVQATQERTEQKAQQAEKPAPQNAQKAQDRKPGTSIKNPNGPGRVAFLLDETGNVVEKLFNPETHRLYNCLVFDHAEGCKKHVVGKNDPATELRYLQAKARFAECDAAAMTPKTKAERLAEWVTEAEANLAKAEERNAQRAEAMQNQASTTTSTEGKLSYPGN